MAQNTGLWVILEVRLISDRMDVVIAYRRRREMAMRQAYAAVCSDGCGYSNVVNTDVKLPQPWWLWESRVEEDIHWSVSYGRGHILAEMSSHTRAESHRHPLLPPPPPPPTHTHLLGRERPLADYLRTGGSGHAWTFVTAFVTPGIYDRHCPNSSSHDSSRSRWTRCSC